MSLDLVYPRCGGIDVHKRTAVATIGWVDEQGRRQRKTRTFGTMTAEIEQLAAWLVEHGVTHVALESTGVYWRPVFNLLEPHVEVVLANAAHVKAVPGRKTDVRDSEWLLDLMQHGLIRGGFIPEAPIRALRDLTRYRTSVIEERTRALNRIQKVLEDTNIKLASVVSDILGVSGRAMLEALIGGETDPEALAGLARGTPRKKHDALVQALRGRVRDHHRFLLRTLPAHGDQLTESIAELDAGIARRLEPYAAALDLLCTIPGIKRRVAEVVLAELGTDLRRFADARHLCSWAAICPGNHESAGKRRSGRMRHGNRWLRGVLLRAAWAAIKVRGGYFGAKFRRIAKRRGDKRAAIAVAHSLLTALYYVLTRAEPYRDLGGDYFDRRQPEQQARYYARRLAALGYDVTLDPVTAA